MFLGKYGWFQGKADGNSQQLIFQVQYRQYPYLLCGFSMPFRGIESIAANLPTHPPPKKKEKTQVFGALVCWFSIRFLGISRDAL